MKPEKMELESMDLKEKHIEDLKRLFPSVVTEGKVDFERLKQILGEEIETSPERYRFTWPGKSKLEQIIQEPSLGTLVPDREESVNFNTTENLFIEGDNLEVLKLLQKSYFGKVKMIYIDPPYNTGKEFIYPDKYSEGLQTYLEYTGQVDAHGKKFSTNTESVGRYHTNWLNMMYPRLELARNLLSDDGVIFISIDDHEQDNLKKLCGEIFGEDNFIVVLAVQSNPRGRHLDKFVARTHEAVLIYGKNVEQSNTMYGVEKSGRMLKEYNQEDEKGRFRLLGLRNRNQSFNPTTRPKLYYPIFVNPHEGTVSLEENDVFTEKVLPITLDGVKTCWTWGKEKLVNESKLLQAEKVGDQWQVFRKDYLLDEHGNTATTLTKSLLVDKEINNDYGKKSIKELFGRSIMDFPKSPYLIEKLIETGTADHNCIILDFFSGSCPTAHAIMNLNAQGNGSRRFIMVQLPEPCDEKSEAYKAGFKTIADIGKERIRRAANKILDDNKDNPDFDKDRFDGGFKVFKLRESNFKVWDDTVDGGIQQRIESIIDHVKHDADEEAILYEILTKAGFELTAKKEKREIDGTSFYSVADDDNALFICLDNNITAGFIKKLSDETPVQVICLESGFERDDELTNAAQYLKTKNIEFKVV